MIDDSRFTTHKILVKQCVPFGGKDRFTAMWEKDQYTTSRQNGRPIGIGTTRIAAMRDLLTETEGIKQ